MDKENTSYKAPHTSAGQSGTSDSSQSHGSELKRKVADLLSPLTKIIKNKKSLDKRDNTKITSTEATPEPNRSIFYIGEEGDLDGVKAIKINSKKDRAK